MPPPDPPQATKDLAVNVLKEVAKQYPRAYANAHRDENNHPEAYDFAILGMRALKLRNSLFGLNGKRGSTTDISSDAFAYGTGTDVRVIDFILAAGTQGNNIDHIQWYDQTGVGGAGARWLDPFTTRNTNVDYTIKTVRGSTLFWLLRGFAEHRAKLDRNLNILAAGSFKYIRAMGVLGGGLVEGHDPWSRAGFNVRSADYPQVVRDATKHCFEQFGIKVFWTCFGSRDQVPGQADQDRIIDIMSSVNLAYVEDYEIENEYNHGHKLTLQEMQRQASRLFNKIGGAKRISLSSPWTTHAGSSLSALHVETEQMHRGHPYVTMSTPHWNRDKVLFVPGCPLGQYAPTYVVNNEWFGFGSYNSDGITAHDMAVAHQESIKAKEGKNTVHSNTGTWGGMIDPYFEDKNSPEYFDQQPGWNEMVQLQLHIEAGGIVLTAGPVTPPAPPEDDEVKPYPDENTWWNNYVNDVQLRYQQAFNEGKRGSPDMDPMAFIWFSRMGYSSSHEELESAKQRHLQELETALGIHFEG